MPIHNSVGSYLLTVPNYGTYGQWIRREVEVDGWGSLETPMFSYPDVLRVKTTLEQRDTVYIDQFSFGQTFDRPTEVKYEWFTNTDNAPVMSVTEQGGQITNVKYLAPITASISESITDLTILTLEEGIFKIVLDFQITQLNIVDINGKEVLNETNEAGVVNIKNQSKGVYILQVITRENKLITRKIVR
jgi:hypothetical protein